MGFAEIYNELTLYYLFLNFFTFKLTCCSGTSFAAKLRKLLQLYWYTLYTDEITN